MNGSTKVFARSGFKKEELYLAFISITFFVISLTQIAIASEDLEDKALSGFALLLIGGTAVLGGGLFEWFIWLANPLYFLSIYLFAKGDVRAKITAVAATLLALSFSTWDSILVSTSGRTGEIDNLGIGYWLWVVSLAVLTIGMFYILREGNKTLKEQH